MRTTLSTYSFAALADLENLTYTGTAAFHGTGNGHANIIRGGDRRRHDSTAAPATTR